MKLPVNAKSLLPHRAPMLIVDRLLDTDGTTAHAETIFPEFSPFVVDEQGKIDRLILVELVAQSYAAAKGYDDLTGGKDVALGYLVGMSDVTFYADAYTGQPLLITVRNTEQFDNFFYAVGTVYRDNELLLEVTLKIYVTSEKTRRSDSVGLL